MQLNVVKNQNNMTKGLLYAELIHGYCCCD